MPTANQAPQGIIGQLAHIEALILQDIDAAQQLSAALYSNYKSRSLPPDSVIRLLLTHGKVLWSAGQYSLAIRAYNQALKEINRHSIFECRAEILLRRGIAQFSLKRYLQAMEDLVQALEIAVDVIDLEIASECYLYIGSLYAIFERNTAADELLRLGAQLAEAIDNPRLIAKSTIFMSGRWVEQGQYQLALKNIYQGESCILEHGDMTWVIEAGKLLAVCYQYLGREEEAELYFLSMLALAKQQATLWARSVVATYYAAFLFERGQLNQVTPMLEYAEQGLNLFGDLFLKQKAALLHVETTKRFQDFKTALDYYRIFHQLKVRWIEGEVTEKELRNAARKNSLNKLIAIVDKSKIEFELLLGASVLGVSGNRIRKFKELCATISADYPVVQLLVDTKIIFRKLIDKKVASLLQELCVSGDVWIKTGVGEFLIIFSDAKQNLAKRQTQLNTILSNFPWSWHDCEVPEFRINLISSEEAVVGIKGEAECV